MLDVSDIQNIKPGNIFVFDLDSLYELYKDGNQPAEDWAEIPLESSETLSLLRTYSDSGKPFYDLFDGEACMSIASCGYDQYNNPYGDKARFVENVRDRQTGELMMKFDILDEEENSVDIQIVLSYKEAGYGLSVII